MTLRERVVRVLRSSPRAYDIARRLTRLAGARDEVHDFLAEWSGGRQTVSFLQVGANDGMANDPIREFAVWRRWRGVVVEPLPHLFSRLRRAYAHCPWVTPVQCAVGYGIGDEAIIHRIRAAKLPALPVWADQIASFERQHVLKHFSAELREDDIEEVRVPVASIEALVREHGLDELDLLHVDVEGFEGNVLGNVDLGIVRPCVILYETAHLTRDAADGIESRLCSAGYRVQPMGCDAVAIRHAA